MKDRLKGGPRGRFSAVTQEIKNLKSEWLAQWTPRLTQDTKPLSPYRVLWDLMHTVDVANTIITHDAGSPRDQISPFWEPIAPAQLHRLGQDHPARLRPRPGDGSEAGRSPTSSA